MTSILSKGLKELNGIQGRRFGVAGFPRDESLRIAEALAQRGGFSHILSESPVLRNTQVSNVEALILEGTLASNLCVEHGTEALTAFKRPVTVVGEHNSRGISSTFVHALQSLNAPALVSTFGKWLIEFDRNIIADSGPNSLPMAKHRILIADDHPAMRTLIAQVLQRPTIECCEAFDGRQALGLAKLMMPDLVILDLDMPGIDGFHILSEIRADPGTRSAAVMFLTSRHSRQDVTLAAQLGANMYVVKPIQIYDFRTRVESLLCREPNADHRCGSSSFERPERACRSTGSVEMDQADCAEIEGDLSDAR